ncbi:MAG: hypothetical protein EG823_04015 [Actinobacteria bacterium]|nr:hypothetical protein [Actinomycetota bacterium]
MKRPSTALLTAINVSRSLVGALACAAIMCLAIPEAALAAPIVPIYTGSAPMYFVDVCDSDVVWADHTSVWMRDMGTARLTQVATGEFGAYPQISHDWLMWQTYNDYYATSYRRARLRSEGSAQTLPARPACELDGNRIAYVQSDESHYGAVEQIDGTPIATLGYQTYSCDLSYPWVVWSTSYEVRARNLTSPATEVLLSSGNSSLVAVDGERAVWMEPWTTLTTTRIKFLSLPGGPPVTVWESASTISTIDIFGDWITWLEPADGGRSYVYAYHIPTAQTVLVTPSPGFYDHCSLSSTWLVWIQGTTYGNGGQVYGCLLTDLLGSLPSPVALRPSSVTLPGSSITLAFQDKYADGTSLAVAAPTRPAPAGYHLVTGTNWGISTQARKSGYTDITVPYDPSLLGGAPESSARLFLWKDAGWIDITASVDTAANTVTGRTYYLSQVAVGRPRQTYETTFVYRFYNKVTGTHFYTASAAERDSVMAKWPTIFDFDGLGYAYDSTKATQPLYRFYNKKNGGHFYTSSAEEADRVIARWPDVFSFDGPAYDVSTVPVPGLTVYRFYNKGNGSHFFTASADERDMVMARWPTIYSYEGPAFFLPE